MGELVEIQQAQDYKEKTLHMAPLARLVVVEDKVELHLRCQVLEVLEEVVAIMQMERVEH
jgi:hypothetical protein